MDLSPATKSSAVRPRIQWQMDESILSTPEDRVKKKLFDLDDDAEDVESNQWSSSSEYFSQSSRENSSGMSEGFSQSNLFDDSPSTKGWDLRFATPNQSPSKQTCARQSSYGTPHSKKQRLFSPISPSTPDKFNTDGFHPSNLFSRLSPSLSDSFDTSMDSMNNTNSLGNTTHPVAKEVCGSDVMMCSPPRIERLQLFDSPRTPGSIARSSGIHMALPTQNQLHTSKQPKRPASHWSRVKRANRVTRSGPELRRRPSRGTNINPFTPRETQGWGRNGDSRVLNQGEAWVSTPQCIRDESKPQKKLALRESNISRYREEFHEVCVVGSGSFGTVYKCINRLDGCVYALKKSHKPVAGSPDEAAALREVCAHAVLGAHPHLVRYYSAWAEDNHMIIQNEYCDGGNLSSKIAQNTTEGKFFSEDELKLLLRHVALGLQHIHSMGLVHLDIKPDNVFLSYPEPHLPVVVPEAISPEDPQQQQHRSSQPQCIYKIGDMGHVTSVSEPQVEEGDCRFLPREILQDNFTHLPKADIFALGLTTYCAGNCYELPKNGDDWHRIRDGNFLHLDHCSYSFNQLLQCMIEASPSERPSAKQIFSHPVVCPSTQKSKAQLCKELNEEKFKNQLLTRKLQEACQQQVQTGSHKLFHGQKLNRSMSIA